MTFVPRGSCSERARNDPKLRWQTGKSVTEVIGQDGVTSLRLRDTANGTESMIDVTAMFVAIGHDPRSELVRGQVAVDDEGYVRTLANTTHTDVKGVFACGDLVDRTYRQAITAAGSGCAAAIDAERWLAGHAESTAAQELSAFGS